MSVCNCCLEYASISHAINRTKIKIIYARLHSTFYAMDKTTRKKANNFIKGFVIDIILLFPQASLNYSDGRI